VSIGLCLLHAKQLKHFADLLEKIFIMDPAKRMTVTEALKHEFIRDLPPV
jgi:hypothetical protein